MHILEISDLEFERNITKTASIFGGATASASVITSTGFVKANASAKANGYSTLASTFTAVRSNPYVSAGAAAAVAAGVSVKGTNVTTSVATGLSVGLTV
jgi:hypothetical protein